jgi:hypothetical protein
VFHDYREECPHARSQASNRVRSSHPPGEPLPPPADLSTPAAVVWRQVTGALPADWFGVEQAPVLTQLCRHTVYANNLAASIERMEAVLAGDMVDIPEPDRSKLILATQ